MNNARRKAIDEVKDLMEKAREIIQEAASRLETIRDEEQDYLDNMPESFQNGEKGEKAQEAIDNLESALDTINDMDSSVDDVINSLEEAQA